MSATRGLVAGVLALTLTEAVLSSEQHTRNDVVGSTFTLFARAFARLVDPTLPLIPETRKPAGAAPGGTAPQSGPASYITTPKPATSVRPPAVGPTILNA